MKQRMRISAFAIAAILMILVFFLNRAANLAGKKLKKKKGA